MMHESAPVNGTVVVCGAGAAGLGAAFAAARAGQAVHLIEARPRIGGTVAHVLIHTIGGLFDDQGRLLNEGMPLELVDELKRLDPAVRTRRMGRTWVLNVCPTTYLRFIEDWIVTEPRIKLWTNTRVVRVDMDGPRAAVLHVKSAGGEMLRLQPAVVVDATGSGELARLVAGASVTDRSQPAAGGLIFRLRGVAPGALSFPKGIGLVRAVREGAADGRLPPGCAQAWLDLGVRDDEVYVKLLVPLSPTWREPAEQVRALDRALAAQAAIVTFLKGWSDFAALEVAATGVLGVRDGGQIVGEYMLTAADVRAARRFGDAACRCAWPIEYWHPESGVSVEYLPDGEFYEIPLRSLRARGVSNLWMAGKCLSADPYAQASARVAGTCWAMGQAVGRAVTCA